MCFQKSCHNPLHSRSCFFCIVFRFLIFWLDKFCGKKSVPLASVCAVGNIYCPFQIIERNSQYDNVSRVSLFNSKFHIHYLVAIHCCNKSDTACAAFYFFVAALDIIFMQVIGILTEYTLTSLFIF